MTQIKIIITLSISLMSFLDLPAYAEARKKDFRPVEEFEYGMGDTTGMIKRELEREVELKAQELNDIDEFSLEEERYEVLISEGEKEAVLYDEFYEESFIPLAGTKMWECEYTGPDADGARPGGSEWRVPGNSSIEVDERNLRASADYHDKNQSL